MWQMCVGLRRCACGRISVSQFDGSRERRVEPSHERSRLPAITNHQPEAPYGQVNSPVSDAGL